MARRFSYPQADGNFVAMKNPNLMVAIPYEGSMIPFGSKTPDNPKNPTSIARENEVDLIGMDRNQAQAQDSGQSALQEHGKPPTTSISPPQSENDKSSKSRKLIQKRSPQSRKPTREEIVSVALAVDVGERFRALPEAFEETGRLRSGWGRLREMIAEVQNMAVAQQCQRSDVTSTMDDQHQQLPENQQNPNNLSRELQMHRSRSLKRSCKPRQTEVEALLATTGADPESAYINNAHRQSSRIGALDGVKSRAPNSAPGISNGAVASGSQAEPISSNARPETIICSDEACAKKQFDAEYLNKYCGIQLSNARDEQRTVRIWLCPECAHKAKMVSGYLGPGKLILVQEAVFPCGS